MNRKYTRASYLGKIAQLRERCPEIEITTDIIVGFPGESEQDFEATLDLIRHVAYDGLFAFNYSDRPQTPAARFVGKVPEGQSNQRLQAVLALQEHIARAKNQGLVGTRQRVLVEGLSKKQGPSSASSAGDAIEWTGRTFGQKIVNFTVPVDLTGRQVLPGDLLSVKIEQALSHSLRGRAVLMKRAAGQLQGEKSYAA
jgi:tRNA-2-methylthio-N6-dimethylallyladenosine synthase